MDDPTKTRGLLADLGHSDACVHPDQHAAVIREWEDAAAEVERLRGRQGELTRWVADLTTRAEQAEAERGRLRARLTGVAIHANRLKTRIAPGTDVWSVLADLLAALDRPTGDTTGDTDG
jgi:hypothetical protein